MATFSKEELEKITDISDYFMDRLSEKVKQPSVFRAFQKELAIFLDKNSNILQTNIVGRQLLINQKTEDNILSIFGTDRDEVKKVIRSSPYFAKFGELQLMDQLAFAIPLILVSAEYEKIGQYEWAQVVYLTTFFKPYASRISNHWRNGVNEGQMMYTIENLSERFDIKKQGTVFATLGKMSKSSFDNYIDGFQKGRKLTDRELHVIYTSGVSSRINSLLAGIYNVYKQNAGKYLEYEDSTFTSTDDMNVSDQVAKDIESDAAVRTRMTHKAVMKVTAQPIDQKLIQIACAKVFNSTTPLYTNMLKNTMSGIVDKMSDRFTDLFAAMFGSFFMQINPETGRKYTGKDVATLQFIKEMEDIFRKPNTDDRNMLAVKEIMEEMLVNCSDEYVRFKTTKKNLLKKAMYIYFVLLAGRAGK